MNPEARSFYARARLWAATHPLTTLALLVLLALVPFLNKPFDADDPLFIWAAQQIQSHPGNPYGFDVNWYGFSQPMWGAMQNPPLMSYYLALAAGLFGWSEAGLHFACLLPALAAVLGTHRLAGNFCRRPLFAALATLFAPGFLVSSTTVMCDISMLAFWIWAVVFWTEGVKQNSFWKLSAAGTLTALALLTKYNGLCLVPLLAAYGWMEKRAAGRWTVFLLIPMAVLCANEWWTFHLYGQPHFLASNQFAQANQTFHGLEKSIKVLNTLAFTGGCFAAALFCSPGLWRKRVLLSFAAGAALLVELALAGGMAAKDFTWLAGNNHVWAEIQTLFWAAGGVCVLALALGDVWRKRDSGSGLLALWVLGIFGFAAFVYWMANARVILPMAPAVAILIARRLEQNRRAMSAGIIFSLPACAALSLLLAQVDYQQAGIARNRAEQAGAQYAGRPGRVWFEGHWGFQFYMQKTGAWPVDFLCSMLAPGEIIIVPSNNCNLRMPESGDVEIEAMPEFSACSWLSLYNAATGAGFYGGGFLPFVFSPVPAEKYFVFHVLRPFCMAPPEALNNRAWSYATSVEAGLRNGPLAVQLAERACELTHYQTSIYIGTLAAAYAEAGRFDDAIATAQKACALAEKSGQQDLLQKNRELLAWYQKHQPYRETTKP